jgi:hypothetical protein
LARYRSRSPAQPEEKGDTRPFEKSVVVNDLVVDSLLNMRSNEANE